MAARSGLARIGEGLEEASVLDRLARPLRRAASALPGEPWRSRLQGAWLGHPVHPALTDLPIGFWTSAWVLDLVGGRRGRPVADLFVGLGVLTAAPTIVTGLADWTTLDPRRQRVGVVHAAANATATGLYAASLVARLDGRRGRGVWLGMLGAGAATAGGFLGGHLTFASSNGGAPPPEDRGNTPG